MLPFSWNTLCMAQFMIEMLFGDFQRCERLNVLCELPFVVGHIEA